MFNEASSRRAVLKALGAAAAAASAGAPGLSLAQGAPAAAPAKGTQVVLLGTKAGPRVGGERSNPASVLLVDGTPYVVDCGQGVTRQLVRAGVALPSLRNIFITHMHSDHNLELGELIYSAWATGLKEKVTVHGPPTVDEAVRAFFDIYMKTDIEIRIGDEGKPDLRKLVDAKVFDRDGVVFQNDQVKVTAARNIHPPLEYSFALRFDTKDRSVVFSGDTNYSEAVIKLAKGADLLIHEALYAPGIDAMVRRVPNAATLKEHLLASHCSTEDVGRVAAAAGVKKLVLSHLVPGDDASITDEMWLEGVRKHFKGEAVVGRDLMVV